MAGSNLDITEKIGLSIYFRDPDGLSYRGHLGFLSFHVFPSYGPPYAILKFLSVDGHRSNGKVEIIYDSVNQPETILGVQVFWRIDHYNC